MIKRCVSLLFVFILMFSLASVAVVVAQDGDIGGESDSGVGGDVVVEDPGAENFETDGGDVDADAEDGLEDFIEDAAAGEYNQDADGFQGSAGLTSNNPFAKWVDGLSESSKEAIAEMEDAARRCDQGDQDACEFFEFARDKYYREIEKERKAVNPDDLEVYELRNRQHVGKIVRDVAQHVDPGERDEFIREFAREEFELKAAAEIVAAIDELCDTLVNDLKAYGNAKKSGCFLRGDEFDHLDGRSDEWEGEVSESVQLLLDVVDECSELTDDDIEGNWNECRCDELGGELRDLCFDIAENVDKCDLHQEEDVDAEGENVYCEKSDRLVEDFMGKLPEKSRRALEDDFRGYEEEEFNRRKPRGCENVDSFKECFKIQEEKHVRNVPLLCREEFRAALGEEVVDEFSGREFVENCMYEKGGPEDCKEEGLSARECADRHEGQYDRRGPRRGAGFDYTKCDNLESVEAQLQCYKDNVGKADLDHEYYNQRYQEGFDPERFRDQHSDRYAEFARRDYGYKYGDDFNRGPGNREDDFPRDNPCAYTDCQPGYNCDPYTGACYPDRVDDRQSCHDFGSSSSCESNGCFWDRVNDECFSFDDEPGYCGDGVCDPWESGCTKDCEGFVDTGCVGVPNCPSDMPYSTCNRDTGEYECYGGGEEEFNVPGSENYDETRGGDGESCNYGYEEDGQGNCIPGGTGDYGFGDDDSNEGELGSQDAFPDDGHDGSDYSDYSDYSDDSQDYGSGDDYSGGYDGGDSGDYDSGGDYSDDGGDYSGDESGISAQVVRGITGNVARNEFLDYYFGR